MISLVLAGLLVLLPGTLLGQDRQDRSVDRGLTLLAEAQRIQSELELTNEQQEELLIILDALRSENAALMEELHESEAYQEWRAEQRERRSERGERMRERGDRSERAERMRERYEEMSPEEREEMRERMAERREEMRAERGERRRAPTTRGLRGMRDAPEEVQELMRAMRSNTVEAMQQAREVLTEEQLERLQELMRETHRGGERGPRLRHHRGR